MPKKAAVMVEVAPVIPPEGEDPPVQPKTIKTLTSVMLKRTYDMFVGNHGQKVPLDEAAQRAKIASKVSGAIYRHGDK
jgi:hypothetical protein